MSDQQLINYIKNENSSDILYLVAVTCIERLSKMNKASAIKAILDVGTTSLYKMVKK